MARKVPRRVFGRSRRRRGGRIRRTGRVFGLALLALVALALLTDSGGGPDDDGAAPESSERGATATTLTPPDLDEPRAPVDLAVVPAGGDPVELARWWAATYSAHIGSEPPAELADRLASGTTERLHAELAAIPPAASVDPAPAAIEGVSNRAPVDEDGRLQVWVTVETPGASTIYDLVLVEEDEPSGGRRWMVDEAARV